MNNECPDTNTSITLAPTPHPISFLPPPTLEWRQVGELSAEARCTHLAGVLETVSSALFDERRQVVNTLVGFQIMISYMHHSHAQVKVQIRLLAMLRPFRFGVSYYFFPHRIQSHRPTVRGRKIGVCLNQHVMNYFDVVKLCRFCFTLLSGTILGTSKNRTSYTYMAHIPLHVHIYFLYVSLLQLLVRMERRGAPFRLLLEACSFIFDSAIEMAGGPKPPESPTLPFQGGGATGGVEESKGGESKPGTQEGWEAFNRRMDAQDRYVAPVSPIFDTQR